MTRARFSVKIDDVSLFCSGLDPVLRSRALFPDDFRRFSQFCFDSAQSLSGLAVGLVFWKEFYPMKFAQLVLGPAGVGKSTYCERLHEHCQAARRPVSIVNLDPAAEEFSYPVTLDVKELITVDDVMEELNLGPNGGLMFCMENVEENLDEWLDEGLEGFGDDDYLVFDCPGQIELCTGSTFFQTLIEYLKKENWTICLVYCLDSHFLMDMSKFIAGLFQTLAAMVHLELPTINVITKMDLCEDQEKVKDLFNPDRDHMLSLLQEHTGPAFYELNEEVAGMVSDYNLVGFVPLDITTEDGIESVLFHIDMATQFGEDAEAQERDFDNLTPFNEEGDSEF
ncbi:hypothetical protein BSKO_07279 [Bryopsis sp. KO-2023]|nr:hypothetical protein BSKO_07279 [Bryopsis sp. KO-2023]